MVVKTEVVNTVAGLCLVSSVLLLSAFSLSVLGHVHLQSTVILRVDAHSVNGSRKGQVPSCHRSTNRMIVSSTHGSGARGCVMASVGTADVPAARPRRCAERSFHWHPHGLGDARWRQEQTSGQGHPVGRGQHHRYHRTQVAGYGRLGTARNRQVAGRDS